MPSANPLEQLRRRMQSHATPAAFAALAEEHRRAGHFDEAIAVCRDGLSRYPTYVSARVTLGRALLDSGAVLEARTELEQAVAQAPDNLAAVRALDAARAACADLPIAEPPPLPPLDVATLHAHAADGFGIDAFRSETERAVEEAVAADESPGTEPLGDDEPAAAFGALDTGVDGPHEFGLAPDWTLPDVPTSTVEASTPAEEDIADSLTTQALELH
ncbi:MAG TPA: tetratricopeptide repeat protein, partial [Luteitalea sp.]|nr:tetratricopeptide repeat protein [Luteitalea sp.]